MARQLCAFFAIPDRKLRYCYSTEAAYALFSQFHTAFGGLQTGPTSKKRTLCWSYSAKAAYALFSRSQIALGGRQPVLNPTIKDVYFRTRWGAEEYKRGMKALEEVFKKYYAAGKDENEVEMISVSSSVEPPSLQQYGSSFLMDAVNSVQQAERARADPLDELKGYLSSPLEITDNILHCIRQFAAVSGNLAATKHMQTFRRGNFTKFYRGDLHFAAAVMPHAAALSGKQAFAAAVLSCDTAAM
ncbi:hypothetical protein K438DRAFT_2086932 [Mycena galopus ATCC 62051]|nr:hypothetical protein K438DRAFT_2086932 [Mycena galopus ATCC 62051]